MLYEWRVPKTYLDVYLEALEIWRQKLQTWLRHAYLSEVERKTVYEAVIQAAETSEMFLRKQQEQISDTSIVVRIAAEHGDIWSYLHAVVSFYIKYLRRRNSVYDYADLQKAQIAIEGGNFDNCASVDLFNEFFPSEAAQRDAAYESFLSD